MSAQVVSIRTGRPLEAALLPAAAPPSPVVVLGRIGQRFRVSVLWAPGGGYDYDDYDTALLKAQRVAEAKGYALVNLHAGKK